MLHWLAGAKAPEGTSDPDATTFIDAPDTPAPVFAVRAFKHAIFGTPQTVQPKPRRHSNNERDRQRPPMPPTKSCRPQMTRPQSSSDVMTFTSKPSANIPGPMPSPTKGILMTPGTAAGRRKTVTFGDDDVGDEVKKVKDGSKSGLPDDCPGKFPSPWVPTSGELEGAEVTPIAHTRGRSKLTEELHKVREESARRKSAASAAGSLDVEVDSVADMDDPMSESGIYWKREYDIYRANTTREVKKLVTKQRAAKSFAREKDQQCTELADELRQEKKKVDKLQKRAAELEAQLKALQAQMKNEGGSSVVAASLGKEEKPPASLQLVQTTTSTEARDREATMPQVALRDDSMPADLEAYVAKVIGPAAPKPPEGQSTRPTRTRHRAGNLPTDIWTHDIDSSTSTARDVANRVQTTSRNARPVASGAVSTILVSSSIDTALAERNVSPRRGKMDNRTSEPVPEIRSRTLHMTPTRSEVERRDSLSPSHLSLSPKAGTAHALPALPQPEESLQHAPPPPLPPSSPFQFDVKLPSISTPKRPRSEVVDLPQTDMAQKENINPSRAPALPADGKDGLAIPRQVDITTDGGLRDKKGRQVSNDRIAAAKARLAARAESRTVAA